MPNWHAETWRYISFSIIFQQWDVAGSWNHSAGMKRAHLAKKLIWHREQWHQQPWCYYHWQLIYWGVSLHLTSSLNHDDVIKMDTFSALLAICTGNSPVTGEFHAQRSVTRSIVVFFDLRLNKRLSKKSWGWWFQTTSRPLRRHCKVVRISFSGYCCYGDQPAMNFVLEIRWRLHITDAEPSSRV